MSAVGARARVLSFSQRARELHAVSGIGSPVHQVVLEGLADAAAVARALADGGVEHALRNDSVVLKVGGTTGVRAALGAVSPDALDALDRAVRAWSDAPPDLTLVSGRRLPLSRRAHVMAVVNVTPDSFSDGGRYFEADAAVKHAVRMAEEGADILDVGGESTRPGADRVDGSEEIRRVVPVIEQIAELVDIPISIDTTKAGVASAALDAGAEIVNDVSAGRADEAMLPLVAERGVPIVLMHMRGEPKTMQNAPSYRDVVADVYGSLVERAHVAHVTGIDETKIIIDPGVGFGKTTEHNLALLRRLREFTSAGFPVLVGTSRKSFIGATLGAEVGDRLEGTAATVAVAVLNGAAIVRVHDAGYMRRVAGMVEAVTGAMESGERR